MKILSSHPGIKYCGNKNPEYGYADKGKADYGKGDYAKDAQVGYGKGKYSPAPYPPGYYVYEDDDCHEENGQFYEVSRTNRWKYLGLVNEPGLQQWKAPERCKSADGKVQDVKPSDPKDKKQWCGDPDRFGLWLDKRVGAPDPIRRRKEVSWCESWRARQDGTGGSYYGYASGIVGLRLFPESRLRRGGAKEVGSVAILQRPDVLQRQEPGASLPGRHVLRLLPRRASPIDPPKDPENPEWKNLTSNPGAQYFWIDRIFFWNPKGRHKNLIYQLFHTSLPGSLDTSLVSSDNINNPRTMNAVYSIAARLKMAKFHPEKLTGGEP